MAVENKNTCLTKEQLEKMLFYFGGIDSVYGREVMKALADEGVIQPDSRPNTTNLGSAYLLANLAPITTRAY